MTGCPEVRKSGGAAETAGPNISTAVIKQICRAIFKSCHQLSGNQEIGACEIQNEARV
jgi:hypothetical protein